MFFVSEKRLSAGDIVHWYTQILNWTWETQQNKLGGMVTTGHDSAVEQRSYSYNINLQQKDNEKPLKSLGHQ